MIIHFLHFFEKIINVSLGGYDGYHAEIRMKREERGKEFLFSFS